MATMRDLAIVTVLLVIGMILSIYSGDDLHAELKNCAQTKYGCSK